MRNRLIIALLLLSGLAHADEWTGEDKKQHFSGSALMGVAASVAFKDSEHPVLYPMAAVLAVGITKEIRDEVATSGSGFSYKDLAADALGAALGVSLGNGVVWVSRNTINFAGKW
jgi:putative lipoprotein